MRIFKDLEMVEQLGSGIPRILQVYPKECFKFTAHFLRMIFPVTGSLGGQKGGQKGGQTILSDKQ